MPCVLPAQGQALSIFSVTVGREPLPPEHSGTVVLKKARWKSW